MSAPNRNTEEQHGHGLSRSSTEQRGPSGRSPSSGERSAPARTEEQQPTMRFVAISPAPHKTIHTEPALRRVDPGGIPVPARPYRGFSQTELLKSAGRPIQKTLHGRSKSESALVRKWHVDHSTLPGRPTDFPLLRTTRAVANAPAHVISNRLSDCLQSRSIKTRFSKSEGNVAKCRNIDFCKFTIRLYSGDDGDVLVEVQRLCGDCISFMKDCRALLNAAQGKANENPTQDDKPLYLRLPVSEMSFFKTASLPPISKEEEADSIDVTADLLSSNQSDSNMLGMESLVVQTDSMKTIKSTAIMASRRILCPNDTGNVKFNMHNYVMSLLIYGGEEEPDSPESDTPATSLADHSVRLRNLALSSLHNALSLFASEDLLLSTLSANEEWYTSVLIPKLMDDLKMAANQPYDACYASRCLCKLAEASSEFASVMMMGGYDAIESAQDVGTREFALLAKDVGSFQNVLRCCV